MRSGIGRHQPRIEKSRGAFLLFSANETRELLEMDCLLITLHSRNEALCCQRHLGPSLLKLPQAVNTVITSYMQMYSKETTKAGASHPSGETDSCRASAASCGT